MLIVSDCEEEVAVLEVMVTLVFDLNRGQRFFNHVHDVLWIVISQALRTIERDLHVRILHAYLHEPSKLVSHIILVLSIGLVIHHHEHSLIRPVFDYGRYCVYFHTVCNDCEP